MARLIHRLNARQVQTITQHGAHADGGGLYLMIEPNRRYFFFRYTKNRKEHRVGIGPTHTFTLAEAREQARSWRQLLAQGKVHWLKNALGPRRTSQSRRPAGHDGQPATRGPKE